MKSRTFQLLIWIANLSLLVGACTTPPPPVLPATQTGVSNGGAAGESPTCSINGWVWHDECTTPMDGEPPLQEPPPGCVEGVSALGNHHANGLLEPEEQPIPGVTVRLGEGACPATGLSQVVTISTDLSYSFTGLEPGAYCVSIDPFEETNLEVLPPGIWTAPVVQEGLLGTTVELSPAENKFDVNFGWDHQFKP